MAKSPRRRDRDRRRGGKPVRPVRPASPTGARKPPAAKPVQPARPPVAEPVKPTKPPVARPVPPVARPAKPPAAKPVAQPATPPAARPVAQPAAPAARPAARAEPPAGRGARRSHMAEEDLGRTGSRGRGRGGYQGGGMSLGAKVGLLGGLVAFVAIGIAVLLSGGESASQGDTALNAFGYAAASTLAAPDARWWRGVTAAPKNLAYFERTFAELLGEKGQKFWTERVKELVQPAPRDMSPFAAEELQREKERFNKAVQKLESGGTKLSNPLQTHLQQVANAMIKDADLYQVSAVWLREQAGAAEGKWLAGVGVERGGAAYDWSRYVPAGGGFGHVDGTVDGTPVRIFTASIRGRAPADAMTGYVAVYESARGAGGGNALGLLMLVLGPILVGFTAFGVAGGHTKNVRALAREIDRLGSSGDPTRQLRAQGAEAAALARSVERMVANIDFRSKHEGADLEEIVTREQQVAQEIHHTLISKNPPRLSHYEVETLFKPGFEIGGDHFEYFRIDDDHLGIILLDTNVRGIPAALVMSSAKSYVRAAAPGVLSPASVLKQVNRHLAGELPPGRHVTALYVVLNTAEGTATMASAGHLPLLVYRHSTGKMAKVNPEGLALGLDSGPVFDRALEEGDIPIGVGDRIVLYTDGALRIQNGEGEEFGEQRFYGAVAAEAPKNSQAFVNFVGSAIDQFHLDVPQNDDITISTVKRLR